MGCQRMGYCLTPIQTLMSDLEKLNEQIESFEAEIETTTTDTDADAEIYTHT